MKTKIHAFAGAIAFITIFCFWTSTVYSELFSSYQLVTQVKAWILQGMYVLIPAMIVVAGSGFSLASKRSGKLIGRKKKRMPVIALTGLLVLLPAAFYLHHKAVIGSFDTGFYWVQGIELIAGASNLSLMFLNIKDGLKMTGKVG